MSEVTEESNAETISGLKAEDMWVWLDLDDTLWDFHNNSLVALAEVFVKMDLQRFWADCGEWIDAYHAVNDELWGLYAPGLITRDFLRMERFRRPLVEAGCPEATARDCSSRMDPLYLGSLARMDGTVSGAMDLLRRLKACHYNIGILSNGFKEVQYGKMRSSGIDRFVDLVVLSDEIDVNKPDARIFRYAEEKAGTDRSRCVMIGDNPSTDIAGAISAGWDAIWFNPSGKPMPDDLASDSRLKVVGALSEISLPFSDQTSGHGAF